MKEGFTLSENVSRRTFLKRSAAASVVTTVMLSGMDQVKAATVESTEKGTIIDLTKCDGCKNEGTPLCVSACMVKNKSRFPQPNKEDIQPYWPQKTFEDWSDKQDLTSRLTPYNWTFIDQVQVEHDGKVEEVFVPRRCMHCDSPTCMNLCPFGAISKNKDGAVSIDEGFCMGGAKCRDACPWDIPQRQAGVGLYLKLAPELAGGGVMYKCDFCADLLAKGKEPACKTACPKGAISFGSKDEMRALAYQRADEVNGYIYGDKENGGTATFYVSKVPFEKIDEAIKKDKLTKEDKKPGRPTMGVAIENELDSYSGMLKSAMIAPLAGAVVAGVAAYRTLKGDKKTDESEIEEN